MVHLHTELFEKNTSKKRFLENSEFIPDQALTGLCIILHKMICYSKLFKSHKRQCSGTL